MPAFLFARRSRVGALAAVFWVVPLVAAQAQPLTFERALSLAEQSAPENLARTAQVESAQQAVGPADALPDPKLILGIDNLPIEGPDRYTLNRDFMTMRRIGFMQEVPNGDKRLARRHLAEAGAVRAEAEQRAMQLEIKRQTALSWLDVYFAERSVTLFDQLDRQVETLRSTVQSLIAGGNAQPGELLEADQEALALQDRRDELDRDVAIARAKLRRWIGNEADQPLLGEVPTLGLELSHPRQRMALHPEVRAASARVGEATAELDEAIAEKTPDWGVELAYNNRDNQFGDMVMVQFTFDLPLFVGTRQGPKISAKQQSVSQMEAEQEVLLRARQADLESGLAELEQLRRTLARTENTLIPLASKRADLELAAYQAGNSRLATVIATRRELIEAQLRRIEQQRKLSQLSASLYYAYVEGLQ
jgi:outer membrane protein, heavy metal efflux system